MSNLTDFFPSGGGGGLTPKFEEFNASGTFTPSQALIDAGGYIELFLVGAGGGANTSSYSGTGGETIFGRMYLTSTTGCSVTIGAGGIASDGGSSVFSGNSAGGVSITSSGGSKYSGWGDKMGAGWPARSGSVGSAGGGVLGYGSASMYSTAGGITSAKQNSGQGAPSGKAGGSGYCLIKWYE
jgi:hypothetical protein